MEYSIKEIAGIIGADAQKLYDAPVSILLTDSRRLSFPEQSLFFALQTKTNDGHNYIQGLYKLRVRNFVVSTFLPEFDSIYKGASESVRLQVIALWDRQADSMQLAIKASSPS